MAERDGKIWGCFPFVVCTILGVVLVVVLGLMWIGSAMPDATDSAAQMSPEREAQVAAAQAVLQEAADAGLVRKVDVPSMTVWIDPGVWALSNRDTKEQAIVAFAACMEALTGNALVTVRSYANDEVLGKFGILGTKILK